MPDWKVPVFQWIVPSVLSFIVACFWYGRKKRDAARAAEIAYRDKQREIADTRIRELEFKLERMTPIAEAFRAVLISKMTHLHTPRLDELMARIDHLSQVELDEMLDLIREKISTEDVLIKQEEREAATMFPLVHRMVERERDPPKSPGS